MNRLVQPIRCLGLEMKRYLLVLTTAGMVVRADNCILKYRPLSSGRCRMVQEDISRLSYSLFTIFFDSVHYYLRIHTFFHPLEVLFALII